MLVTFVLLALVAAMAIGSRLLDVRDGKVDDRREELEAVEAALREKHRSGEDCIVEAGKLGTVRVTFDEPNGTSPWPLNLDAVPTLSARLATSLLVFAVERGLTTGPFRTPEVKTQ